ncbi:Hypothetical predicted protein [Cloeon dipterum]|uniref:Uncharacterized protein n=1 Tax=Cloeon dipterum TaxID=197152 RepID=A0A8S1DGD5_9INSE|nr:Hypothetical predicted protein [Cloeon dipterum]
MERTSLILCLIVLIVPVLVSCRPQDFDHRDGKQYSLFGADRFIKFQNGEGDDLKVDFSFSVPFVKLPLRRRNGDGKSSVDINLKGLAVAAGISAMSSFISLATSNYDNTPSSGLKIYKH